MTEKFFKNFVNLFDFFQGGGDFVKSANHTK